MVCYSNIYKPVSAAELVPPSSGFLVAIPNENPLPLVPLPNTDPDIPFWPKPPKPENVDEVLEVLDEPNIPVEALPVADIFSLDISFVGATPRGREFESCDFLLKLNMGSGGEVVMVVVLLVVLVVSEAEKPPEASTIFVSKIYEKHIIIIN